MLADHFHYRNGMFTTNNPRFLRYHWEASPTSPRWNPYYKIPISERWHAPTDYIVDWGQDGERLKEYSLMRHTSYTFNIVSEKYFFLPGIVLKATGSMGPCAKLLEPGHICDIETTGLFVKAEDLPELLFLHNSRLMLFLLHALNPTPHFYIADLERIPYSPVQPEVASIFQAMMEEIVFEKKKISEQRCTSRDYYPFQLNSSSIRTAFKGCFDIACRAGIVLSVCETLAERILLEAYKINQEDRSYIYVRTGLPSGMLSIVDGLVVEDIVFEHPDPQLSKKFDLGRIFQNGDRQVLTRESLTDLKNKCRAYYENNQRDTQVAHENEQEEDQEYEDGEDSYQDQIKVPSETLIEEFAQRVGYHPVSVYRLLQEGIEKENWRCPSEEKFFTEDIFTSVVLRLLGHLWPRQIKANERPPVWADRDGIISTTIGSGEKSLYEQVRERISEEFPGGSIASIEREFEEIVGTSLEKWLAGPFFKRHISQFKKRPIAWQVQSGARGWGLEARGKKKATAQNRGPVFSCLVYYHKLDADLLPKIRSQYVGPLKSGYETELRALERIENPTADQSARKVQLNNWIDELKALDEKLSEVIVSGFGPESLLSQLRQFAIDDALLALKARWLRKLVGVVREGPLESWKQAAGETELHPEFPEWIQDALTHLDHSCSAVGPKSPEEKTLNQDPDSAYLAALICREASAMVSGSLRRACQKWWKQFDEAVIAPIRQQIAELNEQIKLRKEERELVDLQIASYRRVEIEREIEDLKDQILALKDEQAQKVAAGQRVRAQIEGWICSEAERWEPWLAVQPLYNQISSLDGRRSPPRTVVEFIAQESTYAPDINDGVRVNIAPLQRAGLLPAEAIAKKDLEKAIADRAEWRADERRWCREGKLPHPGWWKKESTPLVILEAAT